MFKNTLIEAIEAAAKILKGHFNGEYGISSKGTINDLVTEVDKKSEKAIIDVISGKYPNHHILSEEIGEISGDSGYKWIIDPIDGTVNYAHGIPICCISIALEKDGEVFMGAVYNPFSDELFYAQKDFGSTLNGKMISVSSNIDIERACLATGFPYLWKDVPNNPVEVFIKIIKRGLPVRRLGSAALDLCWLACGRFDGFWEFNLNPWDSAAGFLIVQEAGGTVTDFSGNKFSPYQNQILATNGKIHDQMLTAINQI